MATIQSHLTARRNRYGVDLKDRAEYWSLSGATWSGCKTLRALARTYFTGTVLDVGAGAQNARPVIERYATRYVGLDVVACRCPVGRPGG